MTNEIEHDYTSWCYNRYERCCEEREAYGEIHMSFEDYVFEYKKYLHDEYIKEKELERNADT